jgi:SAM-dependent methyltransferase
LDSTICFHNPPDSRAVVLKTAIIERVGFSFCMTCQDKERFIFDAKGRERAPLIDNSVCSRILEASQICHHPRLSGKKETNLCRGARDAAAQSDAPARSDRSAGRIAVEIRYYFRRFVNLDLVEINPRMVGKLFDQGFTRENGYRVDCLDFLAFRPGYLYDRVLMNPPFHSEIEHVRHAYSLLKPGGILVSVMSNAIYTRQNRKTEEFWRDFKKDVNIEIDNDDILPQAFKAAGTNVKTWTICFIKD